MYGEIEKLYHSKSKRSSTFGDGWPSEGDGLHVVWSLWEHFNLSSEVSSPLKPFGLQWTEYGCLCTWTTKSSSPLFPMHFALAEVVHNQSFLYAVMCDFMIAVRHALHMKYFTCLKMIYISYASTGVCAWLPRSPSLRPQRPNLGDCEVRNRCRRLVPREWSEALLSLKIPLLLQHASFIVLRHNAILTYIINMVSWFY